MWLNRRGGTKKNPQICKTLFSSCCHDGNVELYKSEEEDDVLPGMTDELLEDTFLASSSNPSVYV